MSIGCLRHSCKELFAILYVYDAPKTCRRRHFDKKLGTSGSIAIVRWFTNNTFAYDPTTILLAAIAHGNSDIVRTFGKVTIRQSTCKNSMRYIYLETIHRFVLQKDIMTAIRKHPHGDIVRYFSLMIDFNRLKILTLCAVRGDYVEFFESLVSNPT